MWARLLSFFDIRRATSGDKDFALVERWRAMGWAFGWTLAGLVVALLALLLVYPAGALVSYGVGREAWTGRFGGWTFMRELLVYRDTAALSYALGMYWDAWRGVNPLLGGGGRIVAGAWCLTTFAGLGGLTTLGWGFNPHSWLRQMHGSTRWARPGDVKAMEVVDWAKSRRRPDSRGYCIVLGTFDGDFLMLTETMMGLLVAPPGAGKTTKVVVPTILKCIRDPSGAPISMVIHDPKPELFRLTSGYRSTVSDCYQFQFTQSDEPEERLFFPRWSFLAYDCVPAYGGGRDTYFDSAVRVAMPEPKGGGDKGPWEKKARAYASGMILLIFSKCERALIQDLLNSGFAEYGPSMEAFPPSLSEKIEMLLVRAGYSGPLWEAVHERRLTVDELQAHPVGTWGGLPDRWVRKEPCIPMMLDMISYIKTQAVRDAEREAKEAEERNERPNSSPGEGVKLAYRRLMEECERYGYQERIYQEIQAVADLPPETFESVMLNFDAQMGVFRNLAVVERSRSSDIRFDAMRGRWVPGRPGKPGHWRSSTVYLSIKVESADTFGPITGMFIESLSKWLVANPPNPLEAVTAYYVARDELDELVCESMVLRGKLRRPVVDHDPAFNAAQAAARLQEIAELEKELRVRLKRMKKDMTLGPTGEPLGPCHMMFVVDEFPVLPRLDCLLKGPDVGRGQKISYLSICQDLGQISEKYEEAGVERFLGGAAALIMLPLNNDKTAERLAKRVGKRTVIKESGSRQMGGGFKDFGRANVSESLEGVEFVHHTDLMSMRQVFGPGKYIVSVQDSANRPFLVDAADYYKHPELKRLVHPREAGRAGGGPGYPEAAPMPPHAVAKRIWDTGVRMRSKYADEEFEALSMEQRAEILTYSAGQQRSGGLAAE